MVETFQEDKENKYRKPSHSEIFMSNNTDIQYHTFPREDIVLEPFVLTRFKTTNDKSQSVNT